MHDYGFTHAQVSFGDPQEPMRAFRSYLAEALRRFDGDFGDLPTVEVINGRASVQVQIHSMTLELGIPTLVFLAGDDGMLFVAKLFNNLYRVTDGFSEASWDLTQGYVALQGDPVTQVSKNCLLQG